MKRRKDQELKQLETVCKMAQRKSIHGLYITYGLQSLAHCSTDPAKLDATLISAAFHPYITLEKLSGEKESYPMTMGN